jgi:hypothetical protein
MEVNIDTKWMKLISWAVLITLLLSFSFLLMGLIEEHLSKKKCDVGILDFFYISAPISFTICLVIMYQLTEKKGWNPFYSALVSTVAFLLITGLLVLAIALRYAGREYLYSGEEYWGWIFKR